MISEAELENALDFLRKNASKAAQAKANRIYMEEYRKVLKSTIMRENMTLPLGAQEAVAYADPRYVEHLQALKQAIHDDEYSKWGMVAAEARIEAWRSQSANERALGRGT